MAEGSQLRIDSLMELARGRAQGGWRGCRVIESLLPGVRELLRVGHGAVSVGGHDSQRDALVRPGLHGSTEADPPQGEGDGGTDHSLGGAEGIDVAEGRGERYERSGTRGGAEDDRDEHPSAAAAEAECSTCGVDERECDLRDAVRAKPCD